MDDEILSFIKSESGNYGTLLIDSLKNRRDERVKMYILEIVSFLTRAMWGGNDSINVLKVITTDIGYVRYIEIERHFVPTIIPTNTTLYHLLRDLHRAHLIERKEIIETTTRSKPGKRKSSVYYRVPPWTNNLLTLSKEELLVELMDLNKKYDSLGWENSIVYRLLYKHCTIKDQNNWKDAVAEIQHRIRTAIGEGASIDERLRLERELIENPPLINREKKI
ncbi:MAG: hypothetical protein NT074_03695 [Methanomicrobiales archaeon]|nr:hypothetical protein [Methanomicrobiales archaeon]